MQVTFDTLDDILAEIEREKENLWLKTVRCQVVQEWGPERASFIGGARVTAVVVTGDGDYLIEYSEAFGIQGPDEDNRAEEVWGTVKDSCESLGLNCKPGRYEA